jgi:hypothetical protein
MKIFNLVITETLQRDVEIEAEDDVEALQLLEDKYNKNEIILDYQDLVDTEFSNCKYTKKEIQILNQITNFCENECNECKCCPEETCILFRIEKIIKDGYYHE